MTTTPCGSASVSFARPRPVEQISCGSSPCCADGETGQPSDMAAGALQSTDVSAPAIAVTNSAQTATDAIKRIPLLAWADAHGREYRLPEPLRILRNRR